MRLEKFLAESGITSRRSAKKYIQAGRVTVNGECVFIPGTAIDSQKDRIEFDGKRIGRKPKKVYLMLNKPAGYLTTRHDERGRPTVMEFVRDIPEYIYPVGRLDRETEGLLLMTNDGVFAHRLTHPSYEMDKTYIAWVEGQPNRRAIQQLREGVIIKGGLTAPATVIQLKQKKGLTQFKVIIHEGKKRQIRRMFRAVGHRVAYLKRVQIDFLSPDNLALGEYRMLTPAEVEALQK